MVIVTKKRGESKDSMFRKFTRAFINEDIIDDVRKKQFYKKPSLLRKEKEKERRQSGFKARFKGGFKNRFNKPIRRITYSR